ncbi:hypothetical protein ACWKWF_02260 [Acinetobacter kookii]
MFLSISMAVVLSALSSVATAAEPLQAIQASLDNEHEVAPCTNGFDDVNVCQLRS